MDGLKEITVAYRARPDPIISNWSIGMKMYDQILRALIIAALSAAAVNSVAQSAVSAPDTAAVSAVPEASGAAPETLGKAADRKLVHRISAILARTKGLDSTRILVRSRDGSVTLSGSVTDSSQIALAVNTAQSVPGTKAVRCLIRVIEQGM